MKRREEKTAELDQIVAVEDSPDELFAQTARNTLEHLPIEALEALRAIDTRIAALRQEKEEAVAAQDFELAASLRDKEDRIKRQVRDTLIRLGDSIRESKG